MNWSDERPTEPGEYWLAVHPDQRGKFGPQATWPQSVTITFPGHKYPGSICIFGSHYSPDRPKVAEILTGALWARRETPADPFKEVGT